MNTELPDFRPVGWLPSRLLQTVVPNVWPIQPLSAVLTHELVQVSATATLRLDVTRPQQSTPRGTLLLIHGLGGSAESCYMVETARLALRAGWLVARLNLRNCGGTENLSSTLAHAGQSEDAFAALRHIDQANYPRPYCAVGF